ncbi:MAG: hypothetical protein KKC68_08990, partial [Candidatus Thermoplasmatota archaeon]|nr:hypothetical protein [Candidatus Thermoplasmatota archaeon]
MRNQSDIPLVLGLIAHIDANIAPEIEHIFENLQGLHPVYYRISKNKLFINEIKIKSNQSNDDKEISK